MTVPKDYAAVVQEQSQLLLMMSETTSKTHFLQLKFDFMKSPYLESSQFVFGKREGDRERENFK